MTDPTPSTILPSSSAPSTFAAGVMTLEAIMAQLQQMEADFGGCLNYFTDEMCQMNTRVDRIARRQACMAGFAPSLSPSPVVSADEGDDADDDKDDDASSSGDDQMTTSQ